MTWPVWASRTCISVLGQEDRKGPLWDFLGLQPEGLCNNRFQPFAALRLLACQVLENRCVSEALAPWEASNGPSASGCRVEGTNGQTWYVKLVGLLSYIWSPLNSKYYICQTLSNHIKPFHLFTQQIIPLYLQARPVPTWASSMTLPKMLQTNWPMSCWVSIALVLLEYNLVNLIQIFDVLTLQGMGFLGLPYLQYPFNSWGSRSIYHLWGWISIQSGEAGRYDWPCD